MRKYRILHFVSSTMIRHILTFLPIFYFAWGQPELKQHSHGGIERQYYLYIPDSIKQEAPLLFVFHGYSSNASTIMNSSGFNEIAEENGFAVCYPQGTIDNSGNRFFNVGYSFHLDQEVDDVGFAISLASYLQSEYSLSQINTFSTGMSNGGDISYLLACEASTIFKAIGPVSGVMMEWIYDSCEPERPMPVLEIHGTNDDISKWDGDLEDQDGWGPYVGINTAIRFWSELNNCDSVIEDTLVDINTSDGSYIATEKYQNGFNDNEVWLYKIINGGHDWPGAYGNMDIDASQVVWDFFNKFLLEYTIGDVDYNGSIDVFDLILITDEVFYDSSYNFLSDLNRDNSIDLNDIVAVLTMLLY